MKYCIIGGSIAGLSCAGRLRELEPDADVTILADEAYPYSKMSLPYVASGKVGLEDIRLAVPRGLDYRGGQRVLSVSSEERILTTEDGRSHPFDKLLIATGARAMVPDFDGCEGACAFTVRNISDINGILNRLKPVSSGRVLISGAGLVSIEMGDALWRRGYEPVFLVSSKKLMTVILDEEGSSVLMDALPREEVEVCFEETIERAASAEDGVSVETKAGGVFKGDILVIGKGTNPNIEFLASSGIQTDWGVLVNEHLETNREGIFAAGDVCQASDILHGDRRVNALWPVAVEQGRLAAENMVRGPRPYGGSVARNIVSAFGNTVFTAGMSNMNDFTGMTRKRGNSYAKIALDGGRLVGCIFINIPLDPGVYLDCITSGVSLDGLEEVMLSGALSQAHLHPYLGGL